MTKIPLILLTGFLGSGKTTLLKRLLQLPALADTAVLINEYGDVSLDHHLVESLVDTTAVIDNGCICCTMRGVLADSLLDLLRRRDEGSIPQFRRVIIETTGLADPAPVLQELLSHPLVLQRCRMATVITCVDGLFGAEQLTTLPEAMKQTAMADHLLITKTDLAEAGAIDLLASRLSEINPGATLTQLGAPDGEDLANLPALGKLLDDAAVYSPAGKTSEFSRWLKAETYRRVALRPRHGLRGTGGFMTGTPKAGSPHAQGISSFCLTYEQPVELGAVLMALDMLMIVHGQQLLRIKGIVNVRGKELPHVVHGVQSMVFPVTTLERWPEGMDQTRETRLVFITRDLPESFIVAMIERFLEVRSPVVTDDDDDDDDANGNADVQAGTTTGTDHGNDTNR